MDRTPDVPLLKTYVHHAESGRWFFVSTIERDYDIAAAPGMRGLETLAWEMDGPPPGGTRDKWIFQGSTYDDHAQVMWSLCQTGEIPKEDDDE